MSDYCIIDFRGHKLILDNQDVGLFYRHYYKVDLCSNRTKLYVKRNIKLGVNRWSTSSLHRDILGISDASVLIDHINGNTLDNRRCNLRIATKSQNRINAKVQSDSSTGVSGVSFHATTGKFQAYIWINGKRKHLGLYIDIGKAIEARKKAEEVHYGEYARN